MTFEGEALVGMMALKPSSPALHPALGPWASAGFVRPDARHRGVGAVLLRADEDLAREHVDVHGERVAIYQKKL